MKTQILFFLFFSTLFGCGRGNIKSENTSFLKKVSSDFSRNSYFISINIDASGNPINCLIKNSDLFFYFHHSRNWDENTYKEKIISYLQGREKLNISNDDIATYGFRNIINNKKIEEDSIKGKDFFISKYFSRNVILNNISPEERDFIIKILFEWKIPSKLDDESGYLMIIM